MVGRGDGDGIDILTVEKLLIKFVHIAPGGHVLRFLPAFDFPFEPFALELFNIAAGYHLYPRAIGEAVEVGTSLPAQPDEPQDNPVTRGNSVAVGQSPTGKDCQSGQAKGRIA
jgi:hypothetical protein